jgi:hypothetical protein
MNKPPKKLLVWRRKIVLQPSKRPKHSVTGIARRHLQHSLVLRRLVTVARSLRRDVTAVYHLAGSASLAVVPAFIRVARPREGRNHFVLKPQWVFTHGSQQRVFPVKREDQMELIGVGRWERHWASRRVMVQQGYLLLSVVSNAYPAAAELPVSRPVSRPARPTSIEDLPVITQ